MQLSPRSAQRGEGGPHPLLNDALPGWLLRAKFGSLTLPLYLSSTHKGLGRLGALTPDRP